MKNQVLVCLAVIIVLTAVYVNVGNASPQAIVTLQASGVIQQTFTPTPTPTVSVSPTSWTMDVGQSTTFTATASGGSGTYSSCQWYVNGLLAQSGAGFAASTFSFVPASAGSYSITVTVTDSLGATSAQSSAATVTVNPAPTVSISPTSATLDVGQPQIFTASASGGSGTYSSYLWYVGDVVVPGETGSSYTFTPSSTDSVSIYATVTDSFGVTSAASNTVLVSVNPYSYIIYQQNATYYAKNGKSGQISWSSTNASSVINAALANGPDVYISGGTYTDSSGALNIVINSNNKLYGDGVNTILETNSNTPMITSPNWAAPSAPVSNITIEDLELVGAGSADTSNNGIIIDAGSTYSNIVIQNNYISNFGSTAIWVYNAAGCSIINNTILNCGMLQTEGESIGSGPGITNSVIAYNTIIGNGNNGIDMNGEDAPSTNNMIDYNQISYIDNAGVCLDAACNTTVQDNTLNEVQWGVIVGGGVLPCENDYVTGNVISNGLHVTGYYTVFPIFIFSGSNGNFITNNVISNFPEAPSISVDSNLNVVQGNIINTTFSGIMVYGNFNQILGNTVFNAEDGINIESGATGTILSGNTFTLCSAQISDSGTYTITNPVGLQTVTVGASVTAGQVLYVQSNGEYYPADAVSSTAMNAVAVATQSISLGGQCVILSGGLFTNPSWSWTVGGSLYVSSSTPGGLTQTQPSGSGNIIEYVGYAVSATEVYFNP